MPVFDYVCGSCGQTYEVFHKVREVTGDVICPSCESRDYRKLMSAPHVAVAGKLSTDVGSSTGSCCGGGMCGVN